jgi:hypothetical protein
MLPVAIAMTSLAGLQAPQPREVPWFQRTRVGMEVGPTGAQFGSDPTDVGYAARFDGREIVRQCVAARAEYVVIWARDGEYAYYNSRVAPKAPGLGARDVLAETVEEARKHALPVIAYCVVQQGGRFLREHPAFEMRGVDGKPIGRFCYNSGYLESMKALVKEQLAYGIDGFHIDMLDQGFGPPYGCWCDACKRLFQEEYGRPMPSGVTWDEDWGRMLEFRYNTTQRFEQALREEIRRLNPAATVDFSYHGSPPFSWEVGQRPVQHAVNGDFVTGETGIWGFSALSVGLTAEFLAATTPGAPYQVAMQRGVRMYHDQTTRPLNDLRWELFTLLAHNAQVTIVDKTAYDGWLDPVAYRRIGQAFAEARAKRAHFGQPTYQTIGLYYSHRTRDWYGRENASRYQQSFHGAHRALAYAHLPWGVILDENATPDRLRKFRTVVLPNAGVLSEGEVRRLADFVEQGGSLVVTGWSGLLSERGEPAKASSITRLVGAELVYRLDSEDNHVRLPAALPRPYAALGAGIEPGWPFLVKGPAAVLRPTTATPIGELLKPHRTVRQIQGKEGFDWPLSADAPVGPAILVNRFGKGTVVTFAASPDFASASEHPVVEARLLLSNAARWLDPRPLVRVEAPVNVESVITREGERIRVHLLGYAPPANPMPPSNRPYVIPALLEDAPMYKATIRFSRPVRTARALGKGTRVEHSGNVVQVLVNDVHEVLVVDLDAPRSGPPSARPQSRAR